MTWEHLRQCYYHQCAVCAQINQQFIVYHCSFGTLWVYHELQGAESVVYSARQTHIYGDNRQHSHCTLTGKQLYCPPPMYQLLHLLDQHPPLPSTGCFSTARCATWVQTGWNNSSRKTLLMISKLSQIPRTCEPCLQGKQHQASFPHITEHSTEVLGRIFSDVHGPMETGGHQTDWRLWGIFVSDCT